ncbi:hypothetical protein BHS07_22730 [Myxococcus xanthus]|nr:hypothetical protein BHS07_22730 [Myxococcus xanthus]
MRLGFHANQPSNVCLQEMTNRLGAGVGGIRLALISFFLVSEVTYRLDGEGEWLSVGLLMSRRIETISFHLNSQEFPMLEVLDLVDRNPIGENGRSG